MTIALPRRATCRDLQTRSQHSRIVRAQWVIATHPLPDREADEWDALADAATEHRHGSIR